MDKNKFKEMLAEIIQDYLFYLRNDKEFGYNESAEDYKNLDDFYGWLIEGSVFHY